MDDHGIIIVTDLTNVGKGMLKGVASSIQKFQISREELIVLS